MYLATWQGTGEAREIVEVVGNVVLGCKQTALLS